MSAAMGNEQQRVDVSSFFADLLCYLSSRDDLAGYEIPQTEQVRDAVAELVEAVDHWCALMPGLAGGPEFDRIRAALANVGAQA